MQMQILEKKDNDRTISGIPLKKIYNPEDIAGMDYERDLGSPGEVPCAIYQRRLSEHVPR
jgi:methylmalonyl-CoA mutase N-terminal domain/subunit